MKRDGPIVPMHCRPYIFKCAFTVVGLVSDLEYLEAYVDGKARSYLLSIHRFNFIVILVTIEHVGLFQSRIPLTIFRQAKQCDLMVDVAAAKEPVTVISQLQQERADQEVYIWLATLYEGSVELAGKFEVQPSKSRNARQKSRRKRFC